MADASTTPPAPKPYRANDHLRGIGRQYVPNPNGNQAKLRRLIQRTRGLQPTAEQDFRLNVWLQTALADQRDRARLVVLHHALCLSEDQGLPFHDVLDCVLDRLEREQSDAIVQEFTS